MLVHTVMWKIKAVEGEKDNRSNCQKVKLALESLRDRIPEIMSLSVGIQSFPEASAWDVVLQTTFETYSDLIAYQNHPDHLVVAALIGGLRLERAVVDYEL